MEYFPAYKTMIRLTEFAEHFLFYQFWIICVMPLHDLIYKRFSGRTRGYLNIAALRVPVVLLYSLEQSI